MDKQVSIEDAEREFVDWLQHVQEGAITITSQGEPVGILISPEEYRRKRRVQAYLEMLRLSEDLRDSGISVSELLAESWRNPAD